MPRTTRRAKGNGSLRRQPNGRWRATISITDPATMQRHRISATADTRTQALQQARQRAGTITRDPLATHTMPTVTQWTTQWVDTIVATRRTPTTTRTYRYQIHTSITPSIGRLPLNKLRPAHLRMMETYITQGDPARNIKPRSWATARLACTILRQAIKAAVSEQILDHDPTTGYEPPNITPITGITCLTPSQIRLMLDRETNPRWHLAWRLMFTTGMRVAETFGLTPGELTTIDGIPCIRVQWQLRHLYGQDNGDRLPPGYRARRVKGTAWLTQPKTRHGDRLIPLPPGLHRELVDYITTWRRTDPDLPVFVSSRGNALTSSHIHDAWNRALDRAGLPHVRMHSARHAMATMMAELNATDATREALIGHADIRTTNSVYTHLPASILSQVTTGIDRMLGYERGDD